MREVILDIPHGGEEMPKEVASYLHPDITHIDLLNEADLYSREFYRQQGGIPEANKFFFNYWRTIIDANRDLTDFRRDGIIKRSTIRLKPLYQDSTGLPPEMARLLVEKYAKPYYGQLEESTRKPETKLVVLGHTMEPIGPTGGIKSGEKRPLINLANGGDLEGNPNKSYQAPRDIMEYVKDHVEAKLPSLNLNGLVYNGQAVSFNTPFPGKKSIARIGETALQGKTALMFEINKSLIIDSSDTEIHEVRPENIAVMRTIIHDVLEGILGKITR